MFSNIELKEIIKSITQHKLRNALTGFGIAWGIFILILMMGFGESFQKGVFTIFSGYAENTIFIFGGETSLIYKGQNPGEEIVFDLEVIDKIQNYFSEIEYISPEGDAPQSMKITYEDNFTMGNLKGVNTDFFKINKMKLNSGRYFSPLDIKEEKAVCVLSENLEKVLFKDKKHVIGKYLNFGGNYFQVIGVFKPSAMFNNGSRSAVYVPYKYFQSLYNIKTMRQIMLSLNKEADGDKFSEGLKKYLSRLYRYDPEDPKAIFIYNLSDSVKEFQSLFAGIKVFIWFVGFCILLTGIISVGNIMYVNINERTREIGIRKAIGATPKNILDMILIESVILTSIAGLIGMSAGFLFIQLIKLIIKSMADDNMFLANVGTNIPIIIGSFILLILSGVIAGILPAIKASKIKPVIALNQEN